MGFTRVDTTGARASPPAEPAAYANLIQEAEELEVENGSLPA